LPNSKKGIELNKNDEWSRSGLGRASALSGDRASAENVLKRLLEDSRQRGDLALEIAYIYCDLGERDQTFAWLEKAFQNREGGLLLLKSPLYFQPIRSDRRFTDLVQRVGLTPQVNGSAGGRP
jgi:tetratricopeptide (TPR) repeat protein